MWFYKRRGNLPAEKVVHTPPPIQVGQFFSYLDIRMYCSRNSYYLGGSIGVVPAVVAEYKDNQGRIQTRVFLAAEWPGLMGAAQIEVQ